MRIRALAVAPLLLLALAGCAPAAAGAPKPDQPPRNGESIKPGPEVVADAAAELLHAGSATVEGHLTADGADQRVSFNLQGSDMTGTVITQGRKVQIIVSDDVTYAKGPAAFWVDAGLPDTVAARLAGRWVRHADTAVQRLTPISLVWLADAVRKPSAAVETHVHLGQATSGPLTGTPVAVVSLVDGGSIEVAAVGPAYPLVVDDPGGHAGEVSLSAFDESAPVVPPENTVDLAATG